MVATCMQFYWRACCFLAEKFLPPAFAVYKYTKCSQFFPRDDRCALSAGGAYREICTAPSRSRADADAVRYGEARAAAAAH